MIRVMIVDDHQLFSDALKRMLEDEPNVEVVGTASDAESALAQVEEIRPDIVLLDIRLNSNGMNGLEAAEHIDQEFPFLKVIILTSLKDGKCISRALKHGIAGYMLKDAAGGELLRAITQVQQGKTYFGIEVMQAHMEYVQKQHKQGMGIRLTPREKEILQLLVEEYSTAEIGDKLCIGEAGVETHRRNLRRKLGVKNTAGLVREALLKDLVDLETYQ